MKGVGVSEVFRTFACSKTRLLYCARLARGLKYSSALYHTKKELKSKSTRGLKYGAAFGSERRKLALVTGSTSGIGLGIAKALAGSNYDIVVNGLGSDAEIDAAVLECRGEGGSGGSMTVEHHGADLSSPKQIEDLFQFIGEKFGQGPDVLVNNAGTYMQFVNSTHPLDLIALLRFVRWYGSKGRQTMEHVSCIDLCYSIRAHKPHPLQKTEGVRIIMFKTRILLLPLLLRFAACVSH